MKLSTFGMVIGLAIVAAVFIAYVQNGTRKDDLDRRITACQVVGMVADDCTELVPGIPGCRKEDCSDIRGRVGYWRNGGQLWLKEAPETIIRPQGD